MEGVNVATKPIKKTAKSVQRVRILDADYNRKARAVFAGINAGWAKALEQFKNSFSQSNYSWQSQDFFTRLENEFSKIDGLSKDYFKQPDVKAWLALFNYLEAACDDDSIKASSTALEVAKAMHASVRDVTINAPINEVFKPLTSVAVKAAISNAKSNAAAAKNSKPRNWVIGQWNSRADQGQSKASFARQYVNLVKNEFKLQVTADTIARAWLPKATK